MLNSKQNGAVNANVNHDSLDEIVEINVGGVHFSTTRATLCGVGLETRSMLSAMFSGNSIPSQVDRDGRVFIDRDGARFRVILNYLRTGTVHADVATLRNAGVSLQEIREEAQYFGLSNLREALNDEIKQNDLLESLRDLPPGRHCSCSSINDTVGSLDNSPRISLVSDHSSQESTPAKKTRCMTGYLSGSKLGQPDFGTDGQDLQPEKMQHVFVTAENSHLRRNDSIPRHSRISFLLNDAFTLNADF